MALGEISTLPVRTTSAEPAALAASTRLAQLVSWRMNRRSQQLTRHIAHRDTRREALDARNTCIERAHSLGLLPH